MVRYEGVVYIFSTLQNGRPKEMKNNEKNICEYKNGTQRHSQNNK